MTDRIESIKADLNKITHLQTELSKPQERIEKIEEASGEDHSKEDDAAATELEVTQSTRELSLECGARDLKFPRSRI